MSIHKCLVRLTCIGTLFLVSFCTHPSVFSETRDDDQTSRPLSHQASTEEGTLWRDGALIPPLPSDPDERAAAIARVRSMATVPVGTRWTYRPSIQPEVWPEVRHLSKSTVELDGAEAKAGAHLGKPPLPPLPDQFRLTPEELVGKQRGLQVMKDGLAAPTQMAPALVQSFPGIDDSGLYPPSPDLAIGPNHVMQVVNSRFAVYDKCGVWLSGGDLAVWAGAAESDAYFDPKVIFDVWDGRWLLIFCGASSTSGSSYIYVNVSQTDHPLGPWWHYAFPNGASLGTWPEFPDVHVGPDGIYISSNQWISGPSPVFSGASIDVLQKLQVYYGNPAESRRFSGLTNPADSSLAHSIRTAKMYDWNGTFWLANSRPDGGNFITLWGITGPPSAPSLANYTIPVIPYDDPPDAIQPDGTTVDAGDARLLSAVHQANRLWLSGTIRYNWGEPVDRPVLYLLRINTFNQTLANQTAFGSSGRSYFSGSLDIDAWPENRAVYCFSWCSSGEFLSTRYVGWDENSYWGTSGFLVAGQANYAHAGSPPWRWGTQCAVDRDLMDNKTVWMVGPFASDSPTPSWDTMIGAASAESPGVLTVTPSGPIVSMGYQGGPMAPDFYVYTLDNVGGSALTWRLGGLSEWQTASQLTGLIVPGGSHYVGISLDPVVNTFEPGVYANEYVFEDCYVPVEHARNTELWVGAEGACPGAYVYLSPDAVAVPGSPSPDEYGCFITAIRDFDVCAVSLKADLAAPQTLTVRIYEADGTTRGAPLAIGSNVVVQSGDIHHYVPLHYRLQACQEYDVAVQFEGMNGGEFFYDDTCPFDRGGAIRVRTGERAGNPASNVIPRISLIGSMPNCTRMADLRPPEVELMTCGEAANERGIFVRAHKSVTLCGIGWEADFSAFPTEISALVFEANGTTRGDLVATGLQVVTEPGMIGRWIPINATLQEGREYDIAVVFPGASYTCIDESFAPLPYANESPFEVLDAEEGGNAAATRLLRFMLNWSLVPMGNKAFSLAKPGGEDPPPYVSTQPNEDYGIFVQSLIDQELYGLAWRADVPPGAVIGARVWERSGNTRTALLSEGSILSSGLGMSWHGIPLSASLAAGAEYDFEIDMTAVNEWRYWHDTGLPYEPYGIIRVVDGAHAGNPTNQALIEMRMSACNVTATATEPAPEARPAFHLAAPRPNPVSKHAVVDYALDRSGAINVTLYDVRGRQIATLLERENRPSGTGLLELDLSRFAAGVYFLRLQLGEKIVSRKIVVIR